MPRIADDPKPNATINSRIATLEAELAAIRQLTTVITLLRNINRQRPDLFKQYKEELHAVIDEQPSKLPVKDETILDDESSDEEEYGIEKLVAFFQERNNEPATIKEMAKAIGRSPMTVKSMIYTRYKGKLVAMEKRGRNNMAYFCLAEG